MRCNSFTDQVPRSARRCSLIPGSRAWRSPAPRRSACGARAAASGQEGLHGPRPVVVEMGGKNACVVTASADLDAAAEGVARSAFGFGGQKCSACSRVYVERAVGRELLARLRKRTRAMQVGNPKLGAVFNMGGAAVANYLSVLESA